MQEAHTIGFRYYNIDVSFVKLWYKVKQDRHCTRDVTWRRIHATIGKAISITYSEFVSVNLGIQHAQRMRRFILTCVASPAVPYFSTLFFGKVAEHGMCCYILNDFVYNIFHYTKKLGHHHHHHVC